MLSVVPLVAVAAAVFWSVYRKFSKAFKISRKPGYRRGNDARNYVVKANEWYEIARYDGKKRRVKYIKGGNTEDTTFIIFCLFGLSLP
jgi:hypothetical protein